MSFATRTLRPVARTLAQAGPAPVQVRNMATLREIEMRCGPPFSSLEAPALLRSARGGRPWKELGRPLRSTSGDRTGLRSFAASISY